MYVTPVERVCSEEENHMTRLINRTIEGRVSSSYNADLYFALPVTSLEQVRDDLRLRRALKRAVCRDLAPQSLIDSIKRGIRQ
jgi:hypothetical protein